MRWCARARMGFYPIPPEVMALVASRLSVMDPAATTLLDPCCGEGAALRQLADALRVPYGNCYAVELDTARAAAAAAAVPGLNVPLTDKNGPAECCAFEGLSCTPNAFSLVYLNPPFDWETGGGRRTEAQFLSQATKLLVPGTGVLVLVAPLHVFTAWHSGVCHILDGNFRTHGLATWPEEHREHGEAVWVGTRLRHAVNPDRDPECPRAMSGHECRGTEYGYGGREWTGPVRDVVPATLHPGLRPKRFHKYEPTEAEMFAMLRRSPVSAAFAPPAGPALARPGMTPGAGHQAVLVASGLSDGLVEPGGEPPFLVRGSVGKERSADPARSEESETGRKTVEAEAIVNVVRCVEPGGTIHTFSNGAGRAGAAEPRPEETEAVA